MRASLERHESCLISDCFFAAKKPDAPKSYQHKHKSTKRRPFDDYLCE